MVSFAAIGAFTRRRLANAVTRHTQKRNMSLGHPPPPPPGGWTGIDKIVRDRLPYDYQIAAAILGTYTTLIVLWRVKAAISKKPKEEAPEVSEEAVTA
ncbi:hypothetical protein FisN_2Lh261 [Fistulifera solaris]|uniref:Uncharacterized protein n=1 Tax=Fistulifera solaris TaxID=1519565 RepID=A0A1Z5KFW0_FISSO|nr:hypothetical protein FisN_2Lh261 [Fistulifera solaris]|eukprot:GAX24982.1 hypothetical protein FisN_2Lh261 [Fistulifera solaris]